MTRDAIIQAAAVEVAEMGYHLASLARIVERSGVTKGALYFHYASKQDIALALLERMAADYRALAARSDGSGPDPLREAAYLARDIQELLDHRPVVMAGQRLTAEGVGGREWSAFPTDFWEGVFAGLFARAQTLGLVRESVDPAATGRFVLDISAGAFRNALVADDRWELARRVCHNWELMFDAIATDGWRDGWRASGGMAAVLADHLPDAARRAPRDDGAADLV